jgi:predicted MFS family arabinose efflux permease
MAAAVALNAVSFNIARAIGPALGGIVMAATSAGVVFLVNAVSFLGVILVLGRWRYTPPLKKNHAGLHDSIREGLHYVRHSPAYHAVLVRVGLFAFAGSALWALLPVVARAGLARSSLGYGILLGCLGAGCIIGASILATLRMYYSVDRLVAAGALTFAAAMIALVTIHLFVLVALAMLMGGIAWMTVMSNFSVCAQVAPPAALRARALAVYLMVFQGVTALGSGVWGALAARIGVNGALLASAAALGIGLATGRRLRLAPILAETRPDAVVVE